MRKKKDVNIEPEMTGHLPQGEARPPEARSKLWWRICRGILWALAGVFGLVVLCVVAIYLPPVQDILVPIVLKQVNKSGDMHVDVKKFRLYFPLDVSVDSLDMEMKDLTVRMARGDVSVKVRPLLQGEIGASEISARGGYVSIGRPDTSMYMTIEMEEARVREALVGLTTQRIDVRKITGRGAKVRMWMKPDSVPPPAEPKDSVPVNWHITLGEAELADLDYGMQLEPIINDLGATVKSARISKAEVDMRYNKINVESAEMDSVDARYIYYSPEYVAAYPVKAYVAPDTIPYTPWTVTAGKIRLSRGNAMYALLGHHAPTAAFDPEYIQASQIEVAVDSFMNRGTSVYVPVKEISARERCGVPLKASGLFDMDSTEMRVNDFLITTATSRVRIDGNMAMAPEGTTMSIMDTPVALKLNATISSDDMRRLVPYPMTATVEQLPRYTPLQADLDMRGTAGRHIDIKTLALSLPGYVELSGNGYADNLALGLDKLTAEVELQGEMRNGNFLKPMLLDAKTGKEINLPPLKLDAWVKADRGDLEGDLSATAGNGDVALSASWGNRNAEYSVDLDAASFPLQSIMPGLGLRDIDASVKAEGRGLDPFASGTEMHARVDLRNIIYQGEELKGITLDADILNGMASIDANSLNRNANLSLSARGNLTGDTLVWVLDGDVRQLDLQALKLSPTPSEGSIRLAGNARVATDGRYDLLGPLFATEAPKPTKHQRRGTPKKKTTAGGSILDRISAVEADFNISELYWRMPGKSINGNNIAMTLAADSANTSLRLDNNDLAAAFSSGLPVGELGRSFTMAGEVLKRSIDTRIAHIDSLKAALPPFALTLKAGQDNILHNYLMDLNTTFGELNFTARNDSTLTADGHILELAIGETRLDSVAMEIRQRGKYLLYDIKVDNKPGTLDNFAKINMKGFLGPERFALLANQQNIQGETGFSFGSVINMPDSTTVALRFVPYHPVIGYKNWIINQDNVLEYNLATGHIDANLLLHNDQSTVQILTEHDPNTEGQEDLLVKLKDIQLTDWLAINPFAPPMKGELSAEMRIGRKDKSLNGKGDIQLTDFFYDRQKVGDFDIDFDVLTRNGALMANAAMKVNGKEALTLSGNLNDTTSVTPFNLDMKVIHFPLEVANPFLPAGTATLAGTLNGTMDVTGKATEPVLNGWIAFDSASVVPTMLGTRLSFPQEQIPVKDNLITFTDFAIKAVNDNPLTIDGWVDISNMSKMKMDLTMNARNMQIVGGKRVKSADVYGKAFVDLDAKVKGSTEFMEVTANAKLLAGTNVTYVIPTLAQDITSQSNKDMVKFVNFSDTTAVTDADSIVRPSMLMNIDAQLQIQNGTTVAVDLSGDGKNRVQLQTNGTLNYSSDYLNAQHVTGRLNIDQGFVRYTPPLMSEKLFNFQEGSYVAFTGDMMNPQLNIKAVDNVKANVQEQNSDARQVTFDVSLSVTGTLENMNVAFDLSTGDDLTVENELKSMTQEQRANSAMNLLVTGMYTGPGTKAAVGGNPLFSLLESQLNSLAAKTIKGVDLSFGIDQLNRAGSASSTMSYSYKVSKSLFDDRFKIVVGGNYTTDADADENFAENLIADISFEYLLNKQGTMYVKIFRHTGYESIIEGEITETGVGFVYKKRIQRIGDMFRFLRPKKKQQ